MWSLLYAMLVVVLYFLGFIAVLLLGLTCPIWIGFLAAWLGIKWLWDEVVGAWS